MAAENQNYFTISFVLLYQDHVVSHNFSPTGHMIQCLDLNGKNYIKMYPVSTKEIYCNTNTNSLFIKVNPVVKQSSSITTTSRMFPVFPCNHTLTKVNWLLHTTEVIVRFLYNPTHLLHMQQSCTILHKQLLSTELKHACIYK